MALTPNYGFIIPTGSDAVNLLTQCYPNFSSLDTILKPIQESGVTVATDTKVGTVHQLVRTDSSCNMFRFIATANYASGDTFTVDGASVTATAMDGTALSAGAFVINQSVVCILNNLVLTVLVSGKETTSLPASSVTYTPPSGLTSTNVQDAIGEVYSDIPANASALSYDNTVSGLTASNVQTAIDELATGSASVHGLFELWENATPTVAFASQSFTIASSIQYDSIWIEVGWTTGEQTLPTMFVIDKFRTGASILEMFHIDKFNTASALDISHGSRLVQATYDAVNEEYTISIQDCNVYTKSTNATTASTATVTNTRLIPFRILGLIHNA